MNYIVGLNLGKVVEVAPAGFVVGTMQWLLVLRWQIQRAGWWVAASTVGWAIGVLLVWTEFVNWTFGGAIYGAITGIARGVAIFAKDFSGHPARKNQQKCTRPLMPSAAPIRPRHLVSTQQGVET